MVLGYLEAWYRVPQMDLKMTVIWALTVLRGWGSGVKVFMVYVGSYVDVAGVAMMRLVT